MSTADTDQQYYFSSVEVRDLVRDIIGRRMELERALAKKAPGESDERTAHLQAVEVARSLLCEFADVLRFEAPQGWTYAEVAASVPVAEAA